MEIIKIGLVGAGTRTAEVSSFFGTGVDQVEQTKIAKAVLSHGAIAPKEKAAPAKAAEGGRKYAVPIPDHLKGYEVPKDISAFINDIYPNIKAYAGSKLHTIRSGKRTVVEYDDVINSFVAYMLEVAKKDGRIRYTRYDPITYPDQPFYKWFLIQFEFYCRDCECKENKFMSTHSYFSQEKEDYSEASANELTIEQVLQRTVSHDVTMNASIDYVYAQEVLQAIQKFSEDSIQNGARVKSFETHAARLMSMKLEGYSVAEIAEDFNISSNGVNQWLSKLRGLVSAYIGEDANIPTAI